MIINNRNDYENVKKHENKNTTHTICMWGSQTELFLPIKSVWSKTMLDISHFHFIDKTLRPFSKYLHLCWTEGRQSYRFGMVKCKVWFLMSWPFWSFEWNDICICSGGGSGAVPFCPVLQPRPVLLCRLSHVCTGEHLWWVCWAKRRES